MEKFPYADPSEHKYLFYVTDRLRRVRTDPTNLSTSDYNATLGEICGALRESLSHGFELIVRAAAGYTNDPEYRAQAQAVLREAGAFASFIKFEKEALEKCGVSHAVAGHITRMAARMKDELQQIYSDPTPAVFDPELVMSSVRRLTDDVCIASSQANETLDNRAKWHKIKQATLVVSGATSIIADAAAITWTLGTAAPYVALSTATGGVMIGKAGRMEHPRERKPLKK